MIAEMWKKLDGDCSGTVTYGELIRRFDAPNHPEVVSRRKTPVQVLLDFVKEFDGGVHCGVVTYYEFLTYWMTQSKAIEDDNEFAEYIHRLWGKRDKRAAPQSAGRNGRLGSVKRSTSSPAGPAPALGTMHRTGIRIEAGRKKHLATPHEAGNNGANL